MKILQISTYDMSGGAARAAYRLQKGLRKIGHDSRMLVRHKHAENLYVHSVSAETSLADQKEAFFLETVIQEHYINAHRTKKSNTLFSLPYPGYDIARIPALNKADVINLHWVAQYQSPVTLRNVSYLGKPLVWTLHDQWPFTGGCHYSAGCENFRSDCAQCPQLSDDLSELSGAILKDKLDLLKGMDITFVTPSRWMASCVQKSRLFCDHQVVVIPNSLETDVFTPLSKDGAKEAFGLERDTLTLLFGGEDANERRKGFQELISAIKYLMGKTEFKALLDMKKVCLLCFGRPSEELNSMSIPIISLGYLGSDLEIRNAYCAADVFVLPSLEDNLPNTVLEAMSCGTPVAAFEMGGLPDMVEENVTGRLAPAGDTAQLGEAILSLLLDSTGRKMMGQACRQRAETEYPLRVQASRYSALYEELISQNRRRAPAGTPETTDPRAAFFEENSVVSAPLEPAVGPHFKKVYDTMLFQPLKESAFGIYRNWQDAEVDRTARLQVIRDQGERIAALEAEVDRWLNEAKRLHGCIEDLTSRQTGEESRNQRGELRRLEGVIVSLEADRAERLQVIEDQGEKIAALEAEVNRWLNESKRLHKAYAETERELNEVRLEVTRLEEIASETEIEGRSLLLMPNRLRMGLFDRLKGIMDNRPEYLRRVRRLIGGVTGEYRAFAAGSRQESTVSRLSLVSFKKRIDIFNASQPNREMLDAIRSFNHNMIDQFNRRCPLKGSTLLDVGASPHGYAMERALACGVALYAGIGLDIAETTYVAGYGDNAAVLLKMDATDLKFPDVMFDAVFSISVFEHISDVPRALSEIGRVLRHGGNALISFEPVWSCSYGHHLHHFAGCGELVPAWAHLIWSPEQMKDYLSEKWPANAPLSLNKAIHWIYYGDAINRVNIRQFKSLFNQSGLTIVWRMDLKDEQAKYDPAQLRKACDASGLDPDELMTKGLCVLMTKEPAGRDAS